MRYLFVAILLMTASVAWGQKYPERRHIRAGNREYAAEKWAESETDYRRALEKAEGSYEARFNMADAMYRQERWEESAEMFGELAQDSTRVDMAGAAYYNAGNAMFRQQKLEEALEEYKNAMRADPDDHDAKYNYAYVKKLLEQQQQQQGGGGGGGGGGGENEQPQDRQQGDGEEQPQDGGGGDEQQGEGREQMEGRVGGMSREDAEQMLEAIQAQEDRTQDKVDEKKRAAVVGRSRKNW